MINVSRVVNSPRFAQSFTVYRKGGTWVGGRWNATGIETAIPFTGTITIPAGPELDQVPEGDRQKGVICVYSTQPIVITNVSGTSDEIMWRGNRYRASQLFPYADYGFYKCIAVKMDPASGVTP